MKNINDKIRISNPGFIIHALSKSDLAINREIDSLEFSIGRGEPARYNFRTTLTYWRKRGR